MAYKKLFIDSDILLDLLLEREPYVHFTKYLLSEYSKYGLVLTTSALVMANINYVITGRIGKAQAKKSLSALLEILDVLPFEAEAFKSALDSKFGDIEDGIQHFIALKNNCDVIITRNLKDYKHSALPVLTAEQLLKTII
ncbi:PIN domain-containing protein [Mucilaginibacter sp. KACC 22063]|uniref:PIN domain-containing protein n=1 Tax=Mucilaginibacter sp. KACC 22063 TaxID=3025666 RepID=UPI0023661CC0|nr:PIN domain-containing protein [Mucilaginibacter sp. KACC 22063]WDF54923.1 PIN domain-containing protein [Mucilaginibacter sp. KACC 22063]